MRTIGEFLGDAWPELWLVTMGTGPMLAYAAGALAVAGWLHGKCGWRVADTRKVFHLLIFTAAAGLHASLGLSGVCLFGAVTSLVVFYALWRGEGHAGYEALARPEDAPQRTGYVLVPWAATAVGGLVSNLLFGPAAIVGYLCTGFGDAIGEPVGSRVCRHRYRVPWPGQVKSWRSVEGSTAVLLVCVVAVAAGAGVSPELTLFAGVWGWLWVLLVAAVATVVEAASPHGLDNLTLQVIPSGLAAWLLV